MVKIIEYIFVLLMEMSWDFLSLRRTCSSEVVVVEGADSTSMAWTTAIASFRPSVSEDLRKRSSGAQFCVCGSRDKDFVFEARRDEILGFGRKVQSGDVWSRKFSPGKVESVARSRDIIFSDYKKRSLPKTRMVLAAPSDRRILPL